MKQRRLIGPTIISLMLCALVADHLFLSQSPVSVSRFLAKTLAVIGTILAPAVDPGSYGRFSGVFLPISFVALVLALVWLSVVWAKSAMGQATPEADASPAMPSVKTPTAVPVTEDSTPPLRAARQFSLVSKLTFSIGAVGLLFGAAACLVVYGYLSRAIAREGKDRVETMTSGLREMVAPSMAAGRFNDLTAVLERYALNTFAAYVYIEDHEGRIIAHWPNDLPRYLRRDFPTSSERALGGVDGEYRSANVYEVAKRVSDGRSGFVHFAIWRESIQAEARRAVTLIAAAIGFVLLCLVGAFLVIARRFSCPLAELVAHAERISKGDLAVPLTLHRDDELGEIARSFERLRSSLRAVTARLEQGQRSHRLNE
jgi:HAMP domain-containing protein